MKFFLAIFSALCIVFFLLRLHNDPVFFELVAQQLSSVIAAVFTFLPSSLSWLGKLFGWMKPLISGPYVPVTVSLLALVLSIRALRQLGTVKKQTHRALAMLHRPKLCIRNITIHAGKSMPPDSGVSVFEAPPMFLPGKHLSGQFRIDNIGADQATIIESYCDVYWSKQGLPMQMPFEGPVQNPQPITPNTVVAAGDSSVCVFMSRKAMGEEGKKIFFNLENWKLYVIGYVRYQDRYKVQRRTLFCREYRNETGQTMGRFFPVTDPDYEFEE